MRDRKVVHDVSPITLHGSRITFYASVSCCRLISHLARCVLNSFDDVLVAGAPAQIAFESVANLVGSGIGIAIEDLSRGHYHPRRAVTALQTVLLPESFLHRMQIAV